MRYVYELEFSLAPAHLSRVLRVCCVCVCVNFYLQNVLFFFLFLFQVTFSTCCYFLLPCFGPILQKSHNGIETGRANARGWTEHTQQPPPPSSPSRMREYRVSDRMWWERGRNCETDSYIICTRLFCFFLRLLHALFLLCLLCFLSMLSQPYYTPRTHTRTHTYMRHM